MDVQRFELGERVTYVDHPDHAAPPVLEGIEGRIAGRVLARDVRDPTLYRVGIDGLKMPAVQLHAEQLEREA